MYVDSPYQAPHPALSSLVTLENPRTQKLGNIQNYKKRLLMTTRETFLPNIVEAM